MARFRKKPVEVEAIQNTGDWAPIMAWLDEVTGHPVRVPFGQQPSITHNADGSLNIYTLEGPLRADVGDWIIRGIRGEFYPCKPDIFEATYDPAGGD